MKSILLLLTFSVFQVYSWSQETKTGSVTSGKITFEEKVKMEIKIQGDVSGLAESLPKERKTEKVLLFTDEATLFQDGSGNAEDEMDSQNSDGQIRVRMVVSGENKVFTDLKNKRIIDQRDFMNRIFLVEKDIPEMNWKITGNQKEILEYKCFEAMREDTSGKKTVVWFAPSLSISGGPSGLCNLPGMILEADINGGSRIYTAKSVEPAEQSRLKLQKPKEGKRVSEEEFKTIVSEKMKEMGMEQGGEGGDAQMRIIIRN